MGLGQLSTTLGRCLALRLFHPQYHSSRHRHHDLQLRWLSREVEQNSADHWTRSDADSRLHRWLDHVNLLGLVDPPDGNQG